jgi:hypothetical protein
MLHRSHFAFQENYLQTIVVIDVNVSCGNDRCVMVVLEVSELLFQFSLVVIVHKREHAESVGGRLLNVFFDEPCTNEVPESLRAVQVTCAFDEAVKPFQEILLIGNAESGKPCHRNTFL